jgi:hypothetical protein
MILPLIADATIQQAPSWWQVVAGILAIPTAAIGLVYTWFLIKKTRLESAKIAQELAEKEQTIRSQSVATTTPLDEDRVFALKRTAISYLILRFIIFELLLYLWGLISSLFHAAWFGITLGLFTAAQKLFGMQNELWFGVPYKVLNYLPEAGRWIIIVAVGWPLFKDANKLVGINIRDFFFWKRTKPKHAMRRTAPRSDA